MSLLKANKSALCKPPRDLTHKKWGKGKTVILEHSEFFSATIFVISVLIRSRDLPLGFFILHEATKTWVESEHELKHYVIAGKSFPFCTWNVWLYSTFIDWIKAVPFKTSRGVLERKKEKFHSLSWAEQAAVHWSLLKVLTVYISVLKSNMIL